MEQWSQMRAEYLYKGRLSYFKLHGKFPSSLYAHITRLSPANAPGEFTLTYKTRWKATLLPRSRASLQTCHAHQFNSKWKLGIILDFMDFGAEEKSFGSQNTWITSLAIRGKFKIFCPSHSGCLCHCLLVSEDYFGYLGIRHVKIDQHDNFINLLCDLLFL